MASLEELLKANERNARSAPCEDDCESLMYAFRCPDESEHEEGSPLNLRGYSPESSYQYDRNVRYNRQLSMGFDSRADS